MSTLAGRTTTLPHMKHKANPYHIIATMYLFLTAGIALMLPSPIVNVAKAEPANPSFDCRKARDPVERAICNDSRLAELDQAVAKGSGQAPGIFFKRTKSSWPISSRGESAAAEFFRVRSEEVGPSLLDFTTPNCICAVRKVYPVGCVSWRQ